MSSEESSEEWMILSRAGSSRVIFYGDREECERRALPKEGEFVEVLGPSHRWEEEEK